MFEHKKDLAVIECLGIAEVRPCGSRVTCDPVPPAADYDYLVVVRPGPGAKDCDQHVTNIVAELSRVGFHMEGGGAEHYQFTASSGFMSWRKYTGDENVNLIVTANQEFAERHVLATSVCKALNLLDKSHRITLFQAILYGNPPGGFDEAAGMSPPPSAAHEPELAF